MRRAVFIDRDGTLGGGMGVVYPKDFEPYEGALEALKTLRESGYFLLAFTNQPDIAKGLVTQEEFTRQLLEYGFDDIFLCPHQPSDGCRCRKPSAYMLDLAMEKYDLDRQACYVVGDRWTDMLAGINAGMNTILVMTGCGHEALNEYTNRWDTGKAVLVSPGLPEACAWIISQTGHIGEENNLIKPV